MQYILLVFSTRDGAMALYDYCLSRRMPCGIVNTPREISASCGISVKVGTRDAEYLKRIVSKIPTYVGAYLVNNTLTRHSIRRLYY